MNKEDHFLAVNMNLWQFTIRFGASKSDENTLCR